MYWLLPPEFARMSRYERIEAHKERVEREREVFQFYEEIEHEVEYDELCNQLHSVRDMIARVELKLEILELEEFQLLLCERDCLLAEARGWLVKHAELVRMMMTCKSTKKLGIHIDLGRVKSWEKTAIERVRLCEIDVAACCKRNGVDPVPFMRLHELLPGGVQ